MKIFITRNYPTSSFYYKVLRFLLDHSTRKEIDFYLDRLEGKQMSECERINCGYFWKDEGEPIARCHYPDDGTPAPCEYDCEPDYSCDDDCGFDPYMGCYTDDC
jgi:hypothetical protein